MEKQNHYDVIIVGAGLSGIGAAHNLQEKCPEKSYIILEGREAIGGTWDLFKYPGIRSDSDMFTLGYSFKPWKDQKAIADGPSILKYIRETAEEGGIDKNIRFNHKVTGSSWSSDTNQWTITSTIANSTEQKFYTCSFLFICSGYYNYDEGYTPEFAGREDFAGKIIHPQHWDTALDYTDKKVVVIGSGATAVTLVPEMAKKAREVVMLQRTPTYIMTAPEKDKIANTLRKIMPDKMAYFLSRWKNILMSILFFNASRKWPNTMKNLLKKGVKKEMGDQYKEEDFDPPYFPWDQRLCLVPDSDLFAALKTDRARIVTDQIEKFDKNGILLKSGDHLDADIIVTATGLNMLLVGGMTLHVDGEEVEASKVYCYRGMMLSGVPNMAFTIGYTNASWTLKCNLTNEYVCRLLNYMSENNLHVVTPQVQESEMTSEPLLDFNSGYVLRSIDNLPKQGSKDPWKVRQNYIYDIFNIRHSSLKDKALVYH